MSVTSNVIAESINLPPDGLSIALDSINLFSADYNKNQGKVVSIVTSPARTAKAQRTEGGKLPIVSM